MMAAVQAAAMSRPSRLVVAVPVSPPDTARRISEMEEVSEFICLETPWNFKGVGQFYDDFAQVEDETVVAVLKGLL